MLASYHRTIPEVLHEWREADGALGGFIGHDLGKGNAGGIIDGDMNELPASAPDMIALAVAGDAVADAFDTGELLDIGMDEFAGIKALVAAHGSNRRWIPSAESP